MTAFMSGYHGNGALPAPIEIVSRIIDGRDRKRFEQKSSLSAADFDASHRASYTVDLPLAKLEPGPYVLMVDTRADKAKTTRYVRFTVR